MPYIEVIRPKKAEGELKEIYDGLLESRGALAEVHQIQSLNPKALIQHMDMYMTIMYGKSPLKRWQREMMAVVVSDVNNCKYCTKHHAEALNAYWKDDDKIEKFIGDFNSINLEHKDVLLCKYATVLTAEPHKVENKEHIESLREAGFSDKAILDAAQVIAYFNFVNRLVLGLGVQLEGHEGKGFKY